MVQGTSHALSLRAHMVSNASYEFDDDAMEADGVDLIENTDAEAMDEDVPSSPPPLNPAPNLALPATPDAAQTASQHAAAADQHHPTIHGAASGASSNAHTSVHAPMRAQMRSSWLHPALQSP